MFTFNPFSQVCILILFLILNFPTFTFKPQKFPIFIFWPGFSPKLHFDPELSNIHILTLVFPQYCILTQNSLIFIFWPPFPLKLHFDLKLSNIHILALSLSKIAIKPSIFPKITKRFSNPLEVVWSHSNYIQGLFIIFKSTLFAYLHLE